MCIYKIININKGDYIMAKNRKMGKGFSKGGYRKHRNKKTTSRSGLPKIYPPHCDPYLRMQKIG